MLIWCRQYAWFTFGKIMWAFVFGCGLKWRKTRKLIGCYFFLIFWSGSCHLHHSLDSKPNRILLSFVDSSTTQPSFSKTWWLRQWKRHTNDGCTTVPIDVHVIRFNHYTGFNRTHPATHTVGSHSTVNARRTVVKGVQWMNEFVNLLDFLQQFCSSHHSHSMAPLF